MHNNFHLNLESILIKEIISIKLNYILNSLETRNTGPEKLNYFFALIFKRKLNKFLSESLCTADY